MILVDSSVWIDYFNGVDSAQAALLDRLLDSENLIVADLVLVEVLQGFVSDVGYAKARQLLMAQPLIEIAGVQIASQAAQNYRLLRQRGITVRKTVDTLIATRCIVDNIPLLYSDRDFDPFVEHLGLMPCPVK